MLALRLFTPSTRVPYFAQRSRYEKKKISKRFFTREKRGGENALLVHRLLDLLLCALARTVTRLGVDAEKKRVGVVRELVLELSGVLE